jgi:hypothetical protein
MMTPHTYEAPTCQETKEVRRKSKGLPLSPLINQGFTPHGVAMHPSQRAAYAAVFAHFQRDDSAANLNADRQRGGIAALRADIVVMTLTEHFQAILGVTTSADNLVLPVQGQHIRTSRGREAHVIIDAIPQALARIKYLGQRQPDNIERMAVGEYKLGRLLLVGVRFLPAERARSKRDEAVVTTAYFLRNSELRRLLRRGQLRPVTSGA